MIMDILKNRAFLLGKHHQATHNYSWLHSEVICFSVSITKLWLKTYILKDLKIISLLNQELKSQTDTVHINAIPPVFVRIFQFWSTWSSKNNMHMYRCEITCKKFYDNILARTDTVMDFAATCSKTMPIWMKYQDFYFQFPHDNIK